MSVVVRGVEKSFGSVHVLRGVDLTVPSGQIFALLGSNGAGKTTLVRILATLLPPDRGQVQVAGFDVTTQPDRVRQAISLTGQFAAVDEVLTGRENLELVARLRQVPRPREVADRALSQFRLVEAGDRPVRTYSGGMRRRLDLAMSLIGQPEVVVLDEPTTGLDPEARRDVWQVIRDLVGGGTTVVLTTQYLEEAEQLADQIAILHEGRILVSGTLAELKDLLPPTTVEYVERQPSLEEVFLALTGSQGGNAR
ncbi:ABC transporter ATP-binding protein [Scrofimicrobium sp. R131]|uniref:ATP-binding cassette domain-containing protein n=1 Tax=Scrofimicrobium appendicitidis TaxID=3079930 RepID=A0AAU7V5E8_9ACTO